MAQQGNPRPRANQGAPGAQRSRPTSSLNVRAPLGNRHSPRIDTDFSQLPVSTPQHWEYNDFQRIYGHDAGHLLATVLTLVGDIATRTSMPDSGSGPGYIRTSAAMAYLSSLSEGERGDIHLLPARLAAQYVE